MCHCVEMWLCDVINKKKNFFHDISFSKKSKEQTQNEQKKNKITKLKLPQISVNK